MNDHDRAIAAEAEVKRLTERLDRLTREKERGAHLVTLGLPQSPVSEPQLILRLGQQQMGIVAEREGQWVVWGLWPRQVGTRFPDLYALLAFHEAEAQSGNRHPDPPSGTDVLMRVLEMNKALGKAP